MLGSLRLMRGSMYINRKLTKRQFSAAMGFSTAVLLITGCASPQDVAYTGALDRATCNRLLAQGIDCRNDHFLVNDARAHTEYFQQALPIHQRWDVIEGELEALRREK